MMEAGPSGKALELFGDYVLVAELGRGGMGVVYEARHLDLDRKVALKWLADTANPTGPAYQRFRMECELVASLNHPNIVSLYEMGDAEGRPFLSMELVEGESLATRLLRGPLQARGAGAMMMTLARAVAYAHQHCVLHRDLKPANILIDEAGEPHLTDFGIARRLDVQPTLTGTRDLVGTLEYLAPEVIRHGSARATTQSDVYGLGASLYEALAGRPPVSGLAPVPLLRTLEEGRLAPPSRHVRGVPRELDLICLKCLSSEPAHRYESAGALADDLERFLEGRPILARRTPVWVAFWLWCRRHRAVSLLLLGLLGSLVLGGMAVLSQWRRAENALAASEAANRRIRETLTLARLREYEDRLSREDTRDGLAGLASLLREHPGHAPLRARLFDALAQRPFAWPAYPPLRHGGEVRQVQYTRDGLKLLSAAADGRVSVWNADTGALLWRAEHDPAAGRFALSPDGTRLLTVLTNGTAQLWDVASGRRLLPEIRSPAGPTRFVAYGPRGQTLLGVGLHGFVGTWDPETGQSRAGWDVGLPVEVAILSLDETRVVLGRADAQLEVRDAHSGVRHQCLSTPGPVRAAEFSFDGSRLLTLSDRRVVVWDASTWMPVGDPIDLNHELHSAHFSPDGTAIVTASAKRRVCTWDAATGRRSVFVHLLPGPFQAFQARFNPAGYALASACEDGWVRFWNVAGRRSPYEPCRHDGPVLDLDFRPDSHLVASASADGSVRVWRLRMFLEERCVLPAPSGARMLTFDVTGEHLLWAGPDQSVGYAGTDCPSQPLGILARHGAEVVAIRVGAGDSRVLSADRDGWVQTTDLRTGTRRADPWRAAQAMDQLVTDRSGTTLAVKNGDTLAVWRAATVTNRSPTSSPQPGTSLLPNRILERAFPDLADIELSPDGRWLAALFDGRRGVQIIETMTDAVAAAAIRPSASVETVRFCGNGTRLATTTDEGSAEVWNCPGGQLLARPLVHAGRAITALALDREGTLLVTGAGDGTARIWNVGNGGTLSRVINTRQKIQQLDLSPDGAWLAIAGTTSCHIWHLASGLKASSGFSFEGMPRLRFSSDGHRLLLTTDNNFAGRYSPCLGEQPSDEVLMAYAEVLAGQKVDEDGRIRALTDAEFASRQRLTSAELGPLPFPAFLRVFSGP